MNYVKFLKINYLNSKSKLNRDELQIGLWGIVRVFESPGIGDMGWQGHDYQRQRLWIPDRVGDTGRKSRFFALLRMTEVGSRP